MGRAASAGVEVEYPDSDGRRMAENTLQYEWIVTIKGNLDGLFAADPGVFVAGDNLIYPVRGSNTVRQAPDVYVAFGRPKGHRGSYKVWDEGGVFPQVVFEVRSPGNRAGELARKFAFYDAYGADEYYPFDPDRGTLGVYLRGPAGLARAAPRWPFASPRLGVRFDLGPGGLAIAYPDGRPFRTFQEVLDAAAEAGVAEAAARKDAAAARRQAAAARRQAAAAREKADEKQREADEKTRTLEGANRELARLRELLKAAGMDPGPPTAPG